MGAPGNEEFIAVISRASEAPATGHHGVRKFGYALKKFWLRQNSPYVRPDPMLADVKSHTY